MDEELLSMGLKPNTIEILKQEGFETWQDLDMLDVESIRGLKIALQQNLILQKILRGRRNIAEDDPSSDRYLSTRTSSRSSAFGKPYQQTTEPICAYSRGMRSTETSDCVSNVSLFSEEMQGERHSRSERREYQEDRNNSISSATTEDTIQDTEATYVDSGEVKKPVLSPIFRPIPHYSTLPTNTSKSKWGMGYENESAETPYKEEKSKTWSHRSFGNGSMEGVEIPITVFNTPNITDPFDRSYYKPQYGQNIEHEAHTPLLKPSSVENIYILSEEKLNIRREQFRQRIYSTPNKTVTPDPEEEETEGTDFSSWLHDTEHSPKSENCHGDILHCKEETDLTESSENSPLSTNLVRNRYGSTKSLDSVRSTHSGYFCNTDPEKVNSYIEQIRPRSKNKSRIPAVIIDLGEVECMYVEEGCLYLMPKNADIRSSTKVGMDDFAPLFNLMNRRKSFDSNYSDDQSPFLDTPGYTPRPYDAYEHMPPKFATVSPRHVASRRPATPMSERVQFMSNMTNSQMQHQTL